MQAIVLATSLSLPSAAAEPRKDGTRTEEKKEDAAMAMLRMHIESEIPKLNDPVFAIRQRAMSDIQKMVTEWVRTKKTAFPYAETLQPAKSDPLEKARRLEQITAKHRSEVLGLRWEGTTLEWDGTERSSSEVLRAIKEKTGEDVKIMSKEFPMRLSGKQSFWETIESIRAAKGPTHAIKQNTDGTLRIEDTRWYPMYSLVRPEECRTQARGSILAELDLYTELNRSRAMGLKLFSESALLLGQARVLEATGTTETGKRFALESNANAYFQNSRDGMYVYVPFVPGAKKAAVTITMEIVGYTPKNVPVENIGKSQKIRTGEFEFDYIATEEFSRFLSNQVLWQVIAGADSDRVDAMQHVRCKAYAGDGRHIPTHGWGAILGGAPLTFRWEFDEPPRRLEYVVPDEETRHIVTFHFPDIPMPSEPTQ